MGSNIKDLSISSPDFAVDGRLDDRFAYDDDAVIEQNRVVGTYSIA